MCMPDRQQEDERVPTEVRPWWHRRQSNEERLADAAEARLLGLAGRPWSGVQQSSHADPPSLEPRQHQPVSYAGQRMQV